MEYVIFTMEGKEFGVPVTQVREVLKLPQGRSSINPLPQAPDFIEGVITLRRHTIAVIDLKKRFKFPTKTPLTPCPHVMVVRLDPMILGLLVDQVTAILEITLSQIDSTSRVVNGYLEGKAVTGIAHEGERVIILLDLQQILKPQEHEALDDVRG